MTRPLKYDDSFTSILNQKLHHKFLNFFDVKVQSTAFFQRLNLQFSLVITSLSDLIFGIAVFVNSFDQNYINLIHFLEIFLFIIGTFFGILGLDAASSLRKLNSQIYKRWRIFITFIFPILEIVNNFSFICNYSQECSGFKIFFIPLIFFIINLYLTKIAWSFSIRLEKGHELLVIHGKYLEKMLMDESYKLNDVKKYVPHDHLLSNIKFLQTSYPGENELIKK
jgi:hypothetical protein